MQIPESIKIEQIKKEFGNNLAILGHHYQSDTVIEHTDIQGDSLELARKVTGLAARNIVFCGVSFMAETAAVLAGENQYVFLPDHGAKCVMADTAPGYLVGDILSRLNSHGRKIVPIAYVNSSLAVKAQCGQFGGSVCTSANARKMITWGLNQGDGVLFLPDKNLGKNTAEDLGIPEEEREVLDVRQRGELIDYPSSSRKKILFWPGVCSIHHRLKADHVKEIRLNDPDARVIVHPECSPEVTSLSDAKGSTSTIMNYVKDAPQGSTIYVGTEENMVRRLADRYTPDKRIKSVSPTFCSNMAKITPEKLLNTLSNMQKDKRITVSSEDARLAHKALMTMLEVCS